MGELLGFTNSGLEFDCFVGVFCFEKFSRVFSISVEFITKSDSLISICSIVILLVILKIAFTTLNSRLFIRVQNLSNAFSLYTTKGFLCAYHSKATSSLKRLIESIWFIHNSSILCNTIFLSISKNCSSLNLSFFILSSSSIARFEIYSLIVSFNVIQ